MPKMCAGCGINVSDKERYRDQSGAYFCPVCVSKTEKHVCDVCGCDTSGMRRYFRTDGTYYCEKCFAGETEGGSGVSAPTSGQPEQAPPLERIEPAFCSVTMITDKPETNLKISILLLALLLGILTFVYYHNLPLAILVAAVFASVYLYMRYIS